MIENKEKNFVSAVVYVRDDEQSIAGFLGGLCRTLEENFEKYEVICVNDASADCSVAAIKRFVEDCAPRRPITIVNMSIRQGTELCMNAGLDIAIGDFLFEFDLVAENWPQQLLMESYRTALTGYDIVSVGPRRARGAGSKLFYGIFNRYSHSINRLSTDIFRVVSRRAVNRVHAINPTMAYRKAAYAASGLKVKSICFDAEIPCADKKDHTYRTDLALNSLALYTDAAYRFSFFVSALFLLLTFGGAIYTIVVNFLPQSPVAGWTTTMLLLCGGFFGIFMVLTIIIKYLSLLLDLIFRNQKYLIESVEKVQSDTL